MRINPTLIPFVQSAPNMVLEYSKALHDWIPSRHRTIDQARAYYAQVAGCKPAVLAILGDIVAHNANARERQPSLNALGYCPQ